MYEMMKLAPEMEKFIETLPAKHRASNVYEIICEDKEGNITERKFGVNIMTNTGFSREYRTDENINNCAMVFGTGSGTPSITDTALFQRIPNSPRIGTTVYGAGENVINNYFDPVTNIIIGRRRTNQCVLDYNYSWLTSDVNITEFGENCNWDETLHTHALIYDANHQPSYFTKRLNEKVTINVYRANSINASLFDTLWNEGKYFFINPAYCVKSIGRHCGVSARNCCYVSGRAEDIDNWPMYPPTSTDVGNGFGSDWIHDGYNVGLGYNASGACTGGSGTNPCHYGVVIEGGLRSNLTLPEMVITSKRVVQIGQGLFLPDGMSNWSYGEHGYKRRSVLYWIENFNLTTPEEITFNFAYTDDFMHNTFKTLFGGFSFLSPYAEDSGDWGYTWRNNIIPVNDFHITSVKGYNYLTGEFDRVESFIDDPDYDFRNPELFLYGYYHTAEFRGPDGTTIFDVFINTRPDLAITGFYDASTFTIYMTDKYWDASTFVKLDDNRVVPQALQHKKYIIKTPNQACGANNMGPGIHPQRERNKHALDVSYTEIDIENNFTLAADSNRNVSNVFASDTGWVWYVNKLIYPESDDGNGHPYMYSLPGPTSGDRRYISHSDDWIVWVDNFWMNGSTPSVVMKAMKIDPVHPDVNPSTTAIDYPFSFFTNFFGTPSTYYIYFDDYCLRLFDKVHNRMVLIKGTKMGYIDFDTDPTTIVPIEVTTSTGWCSSFVWGTNYFVIYTGHGSNDEYQFSIYDFTTDTVVQTFEIPIEGTMSLKGIFGYDHTIYIQMYRDNTTWYMYTFNILSEDLVAYPNVVWTITSGVQSSYPSYNIYNNHISLEDDALIFHCIQHEQSHTGSRTFVILKSDQENPIYFYAKNGDATNSYVICSAAPPSIKKMNGGKDYVIMVPGWMASRSNGGTNYSHWWTAYNVMNLGYIINKGWRSPTQMNGNLPIMVPHMPCFNNDRGGPGWSGATNFPYPRYDTNTVWFGEACFYKNDVIVFTSFSKPLRIPIEMFLFHQITGTTKTIQAFNNPKKIAANSHGLMITNDI